MTDGFMHSLIKAEDVNTLAGNGTAFQNFLLALLRAEARRLGIPVTDIEWDPKVIVKDGGRDIHIRVGRGERPSQILPKQPSIWSAKSGKGAALRASALRAEIEGPDRIALRRYIRSGHRYVWASAVSPSMVEKDKFVAEAKAIRRRFRFPEDWMAFAWDGQVADYACHHIGVALEYLPCARGRVGGLLTFQEFLAASAEAADLSMPWADFGDREKAVSEVADHLRGGGGFSIRHLLGISGAGKTRIVLEAWRRNPELGHVLYTTDDKISDELWKYLGTTDSALALVIDEVPSHRIADYGQRGQTFGPGVRILTIGTVAELPADLGSATDPSVISVSTPVVGEGVLKVVEARLPRASDADRRRIAEQATNNLRLAHWICRAYEANPAELRHDLVDPGNLLRRVIRVNWGPPGNEPAYLDAYRYLCASIDVGISGDVSREVEFLWEWFDIGADAVCEMIGRAEVLGLGTKTVHFFEAEPRALAIWAFGSGLWQIVKRRLDAFVVAVPTPRLLRKFLERCQETAGSVRTDIQAVVGRNFRRRFHPAALGSVSSKVDAQLLKAWTELDPASGLGWLGAAMERASNADILALGRDDFLTGGWGSRRELMFLFEQLLCFEDCFWQCEKLLFRLAQVETEERIANNSTHVWVQMFWMFSVRAPLPFRERHSHLMRRLAAATPDTIELIMSGVVGVFDHERMQSLPPPVVGGRVVPRSWRPESQGDVDAGFRDAATATMVEVASLDANLRQTAVARLVEALPKLAHHGALETVRPALTKLLETESERRALRAGLDQLISWHSDEKRRDRRPGWVEDAVGWLEELEPEGLVQQVKDLTARDYWSVYHAAMRGGDADDSPVVFREMAQRICNEPGVFPELQEWFGSAECRSGGELAAFVSLVDNGVFAPTVCDWCRNGSAVQVCMHYAREKLMRLKANESELREAIDALAVGEPTKAAAVSVDADITQVGFERLLPLFDRIETERLWMFRRMSRPDWARVLDSEMREALLAALWRRMGPVDSTAATVVFDLLSGWANDESRELTLDRKRQLLSILGKHAKRYEGIDPFHWKRVVALLASEFPVEVAQAAAAVVCEHRPRAHEQIDYAVELLTEMAATDPVAVARGLEPFVSDRKRGMMLEVGVHRGLFDALGLGQVKRLVEAHGIGAATLIARHIQGPSVDEAGKAVVPEIADWLLSQYGEEKRFMSSFLRGRHDFEVMSGDGRDRLPALRRLEDAFADDPRPWVRTWLRYERDHLQMVIDWSDREDDLFERG
ncbi:MAG TPA: hypothetical protein P5081_10550 [Phycisphaerae bacterium]|nr:hypothetical protein [Phycisphaerae bacterium]HRW53317.1 hypothetical protein [Phycisphaerae bacterium]